MSIALYALYAIDLQDTNESQCTSVYRHPFSYEKLYRFCSFEIVAKVVKLKILLLILI